MLDRLKYMQLSHVRNVTGRLKKYKLLCTDEILAEMIEAGGKTCHSKPKDYSSVWYIITTMKVIYNHIYLIKQ
jgi:hypothetical protein